MTDHESPPALEALTRLGFTDLEARAYVFLLGEAPATGYRVAQGVGRPGANVYKALESLERKGAILVDDGDVRLVRPVPVDELLSQLERGFRRDRDAAESALRALDESTEDIRVYQLAQVDQVLARARSMLDGATNDVLLDAAPAMLDSISDELRAALKRGVRVGLLAYDEVDLDGAAVALHPDPEGVTGRWPSWLHVVADGSVAMFAFMEADPERVVQAIYTASPFLSFSLQLGLISEMSVAGIRRSFAENASRAEILERFESFYRHLDPGESPGFNRVQERLRGR